MATDSNGKVLFTAGADSTIKSWNIQSAQLLKVNISNVDIVTIC